MSKESGSGLGLILVIVAAGSVGFKAANWTDAPRYPVAQEYALIDSCVTQSNWYLSKEQIKVLKKTCVCALEKTMADVDYEEAQKNWEKFLARFRTAQQQCRAS